MKQNTLKKTKFKLRSLQAKMLKGCDIKFKTKNGYSLWLDLGSDIVFFMYMGECEKFYRDLFGSLIHMNDTVIDGGANIGACSILPSTKVLGREMLMHLNLPNGR
jgi:hypothetical protein